MESAGLRVTPPGPSHWKSGVAVTPCGRVTEQVRITVSPAKMEEEGEEVREMEAGSEETLILNTMHTISPVPIVISGAIVSVLGSVLEVATVLME